MLKWVSGIVSGIIVGLVVWYVTIQPPPPPPPPPPTQLSFIEQLTGSYSLRRWNEANKPVTMGVKVDSGDLKIDRSGSADWELVIWDSALHPQGLPSGLPSTVSCGGSIMSGTRKLSWSPGGARNIAKDWSSGIVSVRDMVFLVFCGGNNSEDSPYTLNLEQSSSGDSILEMTNSEGSFLWDKQ